MAFGEVQSNVHIWCSYYGCMQNPMFSAELLVVSVKNHRNSCLSFILLFAFVLTKVIQYDICKFGRSRLRNKLYGNRFTIKHFSRHGNPPREKSSANRAILRCGVECQKPKRDIYQNAESHILELARLNLLRSFNKSHSDQTRKPPQACL